VRERELLEVRPGSMSHVINATHEPAAFSSIFPTCLILALICGVALVTPSVPA
jgi:hypothetical protein